MTRSDNAHAKHDPSPLLLSCALTASRHLRGGRERNDDEQEGERNTVEYVNIMEAARRCQVSDKTIRRWIHAQKLRARFPQPNRCEIAVCDLEPFLPGHLPGQSGESLEIRVVILERQVKELKQQVQQVLMGSTTSRVQPSSRRPRERTTGPLPRHLVSVFAFAELHRIPEEKMLTHIDISLLPVHRGAWTDHDEQPVIMAFDAKAQQAFHQIYHEMPLFVPCIRCPHEPPGHV
jgi:predicted DNA-binding transcriptional regulator AlpA